MSELLFVYNSLQIVFFPFPFTNNCKATISHNIVNSYPHTCHSSWTHFYIWSVDVNNDVCTNMLAWWLWCSSTNMLTLHCCYQYGDPGGASGTFTNRSRSQGMVPHRVRSELLTHSHVRSCSCVVVLWLVCFYLFVVHYTSFFVLSSWVACCYWLVVLMYIIDSASVFLLHLLSILIFSPFYVHVILSPGCVIIPPCPLSLSLKPPCHLSLSLKPPCHLVLSLNLLVTWFCP